MDKKIFISDKTDASNKAVNPESEIENLDIKGQQLNTFNENRELCTDFTPRLKNTCQDGKEDPNNRLGKDKNTSSQERTFRVALEDNSECSKAIAHQDAEKLDDSSEKKTNYTRKTVMNFFRRVITNATRILTNIKCFRRKAEILKIFKPKSTEIVSVKESYSSRIDDYFDVHNRKEICQTGLEVFEDSKSRVNYSGKTKTKDGVVAKFGTFSETSIQSKDESLPNPSPNQSPLAPVCPYDTEKSSQSSQVRSREEVWNHFRRFMRLKTEPFDRIQTDEIEKEDMRASSESGTCLEDPTKTAAESSHQDSSESPRKTTSESSGEVDNWAIDVENSKNTPRQRIVYDERVERDRGWLICKIKDSGVLMKYRIMKGKYSKDPEKKKRSIEKALVLQEETDAFFDALDESGKMVNIPNSTRKKISKSPRKSNKWPEPRSFSSFFLYLCKSSSSEGVVVEKVFEWMYLKNIRHAFDRYLERKKKLDNKCEILEREALNAIENLCFSLVECHSEMKCKTALRENTPLEDYQSYIEDLKISVIENLICFKMLIPEVKRVISPLNSYLGQSHVKTKHMLGFLGKRRSDIFPRIIETIDLF